MQILVTGGAGFIGSNLVEELVKGGDRVTVLDDFSTGTMKNLKGVREKVKIIRDPCLKIPDLKLGSPELIFHFGIPSSSPMYREDLSLVGKSINEFINVMELAKRSGAKVIYASSSSMYRGCPKPYREDMQAEPFDYYTEARLTVERLAKVYNQLQGVESVGMRMFSVYGPHELAKGKYANVITQMLLSDEFTIYGSGDQTRDFTHVHDVVQAILLAPGQKGASALNVGTGKETSFNEVASLIQKIKPLKIKYAPNPIKNYVDETVADLSLVKRKLGWEPRIGLEEGIRRTAEYYAKGGC